MTGYDREHVISNHGEMDNSIVLSKPFNPRVLMNKIHHLVEGA